MLFYFKREDVRQLFAVSPRRRQIDYRTFRGFLTFDITRGGMRNRLSANWRRLVACVIFLAVLGCGCRSHGPKSREAVTVDLSKLQLQNDSSRGACGRLI